MIPLHVLTGFLGSGKTTLLSALLQQPSDERVAVLVNEVGELALDHHLLESIDEDVLALSSGCICCSMRGEMLQAVQRVLALQPTRIVLETSGIADPAPILHGLFADAHLARQLTLAGVVAVADALRIDDLLQTQPEVRRQLELADRIVLTKGDLAPGRVADAREQLASAAPGCEVREAVAGQIDREWLLAAESLRTMRDVSTVRSWLHHGDHDASVRTHAVQRSAAARIELIQLWLRLVTQLDGHRLLRVKGLVECAETGAVFAVQSAGHAVSPVRRLAARPEGMRGIRMVLIERGMPATAMKQVIAALHDAVMATPTSSRAAARLAAQ